MMRDLRPYPKYKKSKLRGLDEVPSQWIELRAKCLFKEVDERSSSGNEELLSVSHKTGVTPRSQKNVTMFLAESNVGHKICRPGDVVINTMWAWMAALGVSRHTGLVSPSYGVYRPKKGEGTLLSKFTDELLRTELYRAEYVRESTGVNSSRLRLYPEQFLRIPILVPPLDEQAAIEKYLDHIDRRINRYIHTKQKLIKLLAEEREIITHDALQLVNTRSIRLGVSANVIERPIDRRDGEVYTPIGLFNRGRGIFHKEPVKGAELGDSTFYWIEEGDLVLSGQFAWEGAIALAGQEDAGCVASHRYPVLRGKPNEVESAYLLSFFKTGSGHLLLDYHSRGGAGRNRPLNARTLIKEKIPIPPLPAQRRIAAMVDSEARLYRTLTELVGVLREYRAGLVADVVTGKFDVREAAASLPDEAHEPDALDGIDDLLQDESAAEDAELEAADAL
jgi:type I restriction enzyme, S subunit